MQCSNPLCFKDAEYHCLCCNLISCSNCRGLGLCGFIPHEWEQLTPDIVMTTSVPTPAPSAVQPPPQSKAKQNAPPPIDTNSSKNNKRGRRTTPTNSGTSTSTTENQSSANPGRKKKERGVDVQAVPFTMDTEIEGGNDNSWFDPSNKIFPNDSSGEQEVIYNLSMLLSLYAPSIVAIFGLVIVFSFVTKADGQVAADLGACFKFGHSQIEVKTGTVPKMIKESKKVTDKQRSRKTVHRFAAEGGFKEMLNVMKMSPAAIRLLQNNAANNPSIGDNKTFKTWILRHCTKLQEFLKLELVSFLEEDLGMAGCVFCLVFHCNPNDLKSGKEEHKNAPTFMPVVIQQGTKWTNQAGLDLCGRTLLSASYILGLNVMLLLIDLERPKLPQRKQNALLREKWFLANDQHLTDMERYAAALEKKDAINASLRSELEAARSSLEQVKLTMVENKGTMDAILVAVGGMAVDE
jgi:hypothetical protein